MGRAQSTSEVQRTQRQLWDDAVQEHVHSSPSALHHRGVNDVGSTLKHSPDDQVYVPRASWTETEDSTLKSTRATFDPKQFVADEVGRVLRDQKRKQFLARQMDSSGREKQTLSLERQEFNMQVKLDTDMQAEQRLQANQEREKLHADFRAALDRQNADNARRSRERRILETHEAAELKTRTERQLLEEMDKKDKRKLAAKQEYLAAMTDLETKRSNERAEKQRDNAAIQQQQLRESKAPERPSPRQCRIQGTQAMRDAIIERYQSTTGQTELAKTMQDEMRQADDEQRFNKRSDKYYARRQEARAKQQREVVQTMDGQVRAHEKRRDLARMLKQAELEAVQAAVSQGLAKEMQNKREVKAKRMQGQSEVLAMIADGERREKNESISRPIAKSTMKSMSTSSMSSKSSQAHTAAASPSTAKAHWLPEHVGIDRKYHSRIAPLSWGSSYVEGAASEDG